MKAVLGTIVSLIAILTAVVGAYRWLEMEYAKDRAVRQTELSIRADYLNLDLNQASAWAQHYRRKRDDEGLTKGEAQRLEHLERQLERGYRRAEILEQAQITLQSQ